MKMPCHITDGKQYDDDQGEPHFCDIHELDYVGECEGCKEDRAWYMKEMEREIGDELVDTLRGIGGP